MCGIKTNFICPDQVGMYISSEGVFRLVNADYHEQKEVVVMEIGWCQVRHVLGNLLD